MKLFLCGFSGAGKTTLGAKLSKDDQFAVFDLDEEIFNRMGSGHDHLGDYIEEIGIDEFRKDELSVLKMLDQNFKDNYLIILGAGALETKEVIEFITQNQGKLIYLKEDFETCFARIAKASERPLVKNGKSFMKQKYDARLALYEKSELVLTPDEANSLSNIGELLNML